MKHLTVAALIALVMLPAAYADNDASPAPATPPSVLVKTAKVGERSVSESLPAFGSVATAPYRAVTLAAPRDSRIASVEVNSGEAVKKGQIVLTLAPTPTSRAAFVQAQSAATYASTALTHTRNLYKEHLATRDQLAASEQAAKDAEANLQNAQQAGGAGQLALRASADAVVMSVNVNSGEQVAANSTLLTLGLQGALTVRLGVSPDQVSNIHVGMPVSLHDVYNPAIRFKARVTNVSGMVDGTSGLADVFVRLSKPVAGLLPGSYVQGEITLSEAHALAVPRAAVLNEDNQAYLFVIEHQIAHRVNVTRLADDGTWTAVKGDIKQGAEVVTLGNYELTDGMHIRKGSR